MLIARKALMIEDLRRKKHAEWETKKSNKKTKRGRIQEIFTDQPRGQ